MNTFAVTVDLLPKQFSNEIDTARSNANITVVRSDIKTMEDVHIWVRQYSENTNTQWIVRKSLPKGDKIVCSKKFVCHHSGSRKITPELNKRGLSKNSRCEAYIHLQIKLRTRNTIKKDVFVKKNLCGIIKMENQHTHTLNGAESLRFLSATSPLREIFLGYFKDGMGIAESRKHHTNILKFTNDDDIKYKIASGRSNPSTRTIRHWHDQWRLQNFGTRTSANLIETGGISASSMSISAEHEGPTDKQKNSADEFTIWVDSAAEFFCSLCGCKSTQDLTNHFKFCKYIENPDETSDTSSLKIEVKSEEEELHDEHTTADSIFHIKLEETEFSETTIYDHTKPYEQSINPLNTETTEELFNNESTQLEEHVTIHCEKKRKLEECEFTETTFYDPTCTKQYEQSIDPVKTEIPDDLFKHEYEEHMTVDCEKKLKLEECEFTETTLYDPTCTKQYEQSINPVKTETPDDVFKNQLTQLEEHMTVHCEKKIKLEECEFTETTIYDPTCTKQYEQSIDPLKTEKPDELFKHEYEEHMTVHCEKGIKLEECEFTETTLYDPTCRKQYEQSINPVKTETPDEVFKNELTQLKEHMTVHCEKKIKLEECEFTETIIYDPTCTKQYEQSIDPVNTETPEELIKHQSTQLEEHMTVHCVEKKYYCDTCNYSTMQPGCLKAHKRRHTAKKAGKERMRELSDKQVKCSYCDYTSALNSNLIQHIRTHSGEKPFQCSYCDYGSTQQAPLIEHTRMHTGHKPFKCGLCDYTCTLRGYLAAHMRSKHTLEKSYKCLRCEYTSKQPNQLTYHMKIKHRSHFKCTMCNYTALQHSDLQKHMKIHKLDKPFKCKLCVYTCAQRGYLIHHMRISHTEEQM